MFWYVVSLNIFTSYAVFWLDSRVSKYKQRARKGVKWHSLESLPYYCNEMVALLLDHLLFQFHNQFGNTVH